MTSWLAAWLGSSFCLAMAIINTFIPASRCYVPRAFFEPTAMYISDELVILLKHTGDVS